MGEEGGGGGGRKVERVGEKKVGQGCTIEGTWCVIVVMVCHIVGIHVVVVIAVRESS